MPPRDQTEIDRQFRTIVRVNNLAQDCDPTSLRPATLKDVLEVVDFWKECAEMMGSIAVGGAVDIVERTRTLHASYKIGLAKAAAYLDQKIQSIRD